MSRIYMARPRYGHVEREHEASAFSSFSRDKHGVFLGDQPGSATPSDFNKEWCRCLNEKVPYDYFLMLHADLAPLSDGRPWGDLLIEEAENNGYDVLHAFARIKDWSGNTSTLVTGSLDPFGTPARRVTMKELQSLPPTFDASHYRCVMNLDWPNAYMGINTGCMLVDLRYHRKVFRRFPGFSWTTLVMGPRRDDPSLYVPLDNPECDLDGELRSYFWPEDWAFGQWCEKQGLRVGGTSKVVTNHYGTAYFSTHPTHACGPEHDEGGL